MHVPTIPYYCKPSRCSTQTVAVLDYPSSAPNSPLMKSSSRNYGTSFICYDII